MDLKLIENTNNLEITNSDLTLVSGSVYVANKIRIALRTFKTEWYLNINAGLPYYEEIFIKNPNVDFIADLYQSEILKIKEVKELTEFELTLENRKMTITFTAILQSGEILKQTEII